MSRYILADTRDAAERTARDLQAEGCRIHRGLNDAAPGWRLDRGRHVHLAHVSDRRAVEAALLLAARGAGLVAWGATSAEAAELYDGLSRMGTVEFVHRMPSDPAGLSPDQIRMLALLAGGATQVEVARRLGWSRRTVSRRLADARAALGVATTTEAVVLWRALPSSGVEPPSGR